MEVSFNNPQYLFFLLSIPLLIISHFFTMVYLKRRAFKFANLEAIKRVTGGEKAEFRNTIFLSRNIGLLVLRVLVLAFLIFSAAGMVVWIDQLTSQFDVVLVIDSSASMLADDFLPNRLEAAKVAASDFASKLSSETSMGVISFSGTSFVDSPMIGDIDLLRDRIEDIQIKRSGGTDIGGAIVSGTNLLLAKEANSEHARVMVLLTDGQHNAGTPVEEGIFYAKENNVRVFTVGMGTEAGGSFLRTEGV